MKTLIVYDNTGIIISQITGSYYVPVGLPYIELTEIPEGKRISKVDVSTTPHQVIFEDIPPSETEIMKSKIAEQEQAITELTMIIAKLQGGNA